MFDKDYLRKGAVMAYTSAKSTRPVYVQITDIQLEGDVYMAENVHGKWVYSKKGTKKMPVEALDKMYFVDENELHNALYSHPQILLDRI